MSKERGEAPQGPVINKAPQGPVVNECGVAKCLLSIPINDLF